MRLPPRFAALIPAFGLALMLGFVLPATATACPLHITLTHRDGLSTVYFARPSAIAAGSPAEAQAEILETDIVNFNVIESAFDGK
jgi:hypothetical protein